MNTQINLSSLDLSNGDISLEIVEDRTALEADSSMPNYEIYNPVARLDGEGNPVIYYENKFGNSGHMICITDDLRLEDGVLFYLD